MTTIKMKQPKKKIVVRIPDTKKEEISKYAESLIKSGNYKGLSEIAKKYGIATESCRKILIANGVQIPTAKLSLSTPVITKNDPVEETENNEEKVEDFNIVRSSKVVKAVTCSERHITAYGQRSIFGTAVDSSDMFNFDKLKEIAKKFIDQNIEFYNGESVDTLELTVTGLTMLTTAVITACNEKGVNLNLMHYNRETKTYEKQVIFNNGKTRKNPVISYFVGSKIYQYQKTNIFKFGDADKFYAVKVCEYTAMNKYTPALMEVYISDSYEDSFEMFSKLLKQNKDKHTKVAITYAAYQIAGDNISQIKDTVISKAYNSTAI